MIKVPTITQLGLGKLAINHFANKLISKASEY